MSRYSISIVIPTFNKAHLTVSCMESLVSHASNALDFEVIVVDNASVDETRSFLATLSGDVQLILNDTNEGFGPACNKGAAAANGEFIVFLNNDTNVTPRWLEALYETMTQDEQIGALQPRLLYPDGRLNSAGDLVFADQCWNYGKGHPLPYAPQFSQRRAVDYASGACLMVRSNAFARIGGFDDRYAPAYYEDTDLSFAMRAAGYKTIYEPAANVIHIEGGTAGTELDSRFKREQMERNRLRFWQKWADELITRPLYSPDILESWAHRDQGPFSPLPTTTNDFVTK